MKFDENSRMPRAAKRKWSDSGKASLRADATTQTNISAVAIRKRQTRLTCGETTPTCSEIANQEALQASTVST
jgi:hypothetical protein